MTRTTRLTKENPLERLGDREREDLQGDVAEHVGGAARPGAGRVVVRDGPDRVDVQQVLLRAGAARRPRHDEVVDQELEDLRRLDHVVVVGRNSHRVAAPADADEAPGRLPGVVGSFLRRPARGLPAHAQREAVRYRGGHQSEDQRGALLPGRGGHRDAAARRHPRLIVVLDGPDRRGGNWSGELGRTRGGAAVLRRTDDLVAHHEREGLGRLLVGIVVRRDRNREAAGRDGQRHFAPHGAVVLAGSCRAVCGMPDGAHGRAGRNALGGHPEGEGAAFDDGDVGDAHRTGALRGQGRGREQEGRHRQDEQRSTQHGVSSNGGPPPRGPAGPVVRRRREAGARQGEHERRSARHDVSRDRGPFPDPAGVPDHRTANRTDPLPPHGFPSPPVAPAVAPAAAPAGRGAAAAVPGRAGSEAPRAPPAFRLRRPARAARAAAAADGTSGTS